MKLQSPIHSNDVEMFLDDYVRQTKVELIESAKKSELLKVAEKKGIVLGSQDLGLFRNVYAFSDVANKNGARLPDAIFQRALPTIVMKPINIGHKKVLVGYEDGNPVFELKRKPVVGVYFDYVYKAKEKLAITYGVFFKAIYPELWEEAKKMMKAGNLKSSYEAWCPDSKKKMRDDGTYDLNFIEFAGGSLLFDDRAKYPDQEPAFDGAKVLELARKDIDIELDKKVMEFANIASNDIIISSTRIETMQEQSDSTSEEPTKPVSPRSSVNFRLSCLHCASPISNVEEDSDSKAVVRCDYCNSRYEIKFAQKQNEYLREFPIMLSANADCPQCQTPNDFFYRLNDASSIRDVKCVNCKMQFPVAVPEVAELRPIISVKDLEPFIPTEDSLEISGTQSAQQVEGISIDEQTERLSDSSESEFRASSIQEEEVDKAMHYASLRKAAGKIRELRKTILKVQEEGDSKVAKLEKRVRKACGKIVNANNLYKATREEMESVKMECASKVEMYLSNAQTLIERKSHLGEFGKDLTDEQILNDKDFEFACVKKENAELKAQLTQKAAEPQVEVSNIESASVVTEDVIVASSKSAGFGTGGGYYDDPERQKMIDSLAFGSDDED